MSFEELKAEILKLSPEARATLARELLASLDCMDEDETEKLWLEEAERRDKDLDGGLAKSRPAGDVLKDARALRK
ncbi:TPA: addiction module protein [Candidatus Woesearchaeota archaeon]|nr:addiction module protein [Candidatus Woesearchaeota archaeon]